jgi:integrase
LRWHNHYYTIYRIVASYFRGKYHAKVFILAIIDTVSTIFVTALNSGFRKEEILSLKWDMVDMKHGFILLDQTKNGERREIPVNGTLRTTFKTLPRRLDGGYAFFDPKTGERYQDIKHSFPLLHNQGIVHNG